MSPIVLYLIDVQRNARVRSLRWYEATHPTRPFIIGSASSSNIHPPKITTVKVFCSACHGGREGLRRFCQDRTSLQVTIFSPVNSVRCGPIEPSPRRQQIGNISQLSARARGVGRRRHISRNPHRNRVRVCHIPVTYDQLENERMTVPRLWSPEAWPCGICSI